MDSGAFDCLARRVAPTASRRTALAGLGALLAHVLAPQQTGAQPRTPCRTLGQRCIPERNLDCCPGTTCQDGRCRCPEGKRRCGQRCIAASRCCNDNCGGGAICRNDRCVCPNGQKRCRGRCIPRGQCCRDGECGPNRACRKGRCRNTGCGAGTKPCNGGCIPTDACCPACGLGLTCRESTCCTGTSAELTTALAAGGPATIQLCPNTTYTGTFTIVRNVTVIGAGAASSVLDGAGSGPVVTVTGAVTAAELRTLGITGGVLTGADRGAGILNQGEFLLTGVQVANNRANSGGGIATRGGNLTLVDAVVADNTGHFVAGGILVESGASLVLAESSRVEDNQTTDSSGTGGGIKVQGGATVTLRDRSVVRRNSTRQGGGIQVERGTVHLRDDSRVEANTPTNQGGGIAVSSSDGRLELHERSVVTLNVAQGGANSGGGIINIGGVVQINDQAQVTLNTPDNCEPTVGTCT